MAIAKGKTEREYQSIIESTAVSGQEARAVVNPDGSSIGGGTVETVGADGASNTANAQITSSRMMGFNGTTWDRIKAGVTAVTSTFTGFLNTLPWGIYHTTPTTRTDGQGGPLETDPSGNLKNVEQYAPGYEDNVNNVAKVEQRYSYSAVAVADLQVKASAGFIHTLTISCNDAAPTAGSLIVYDSTAESGTVVFSHTFTTTPFVPFTVILDCTMATGIYVGLTTTADVNFSCSYR